MIILSHLRQLLASEFSEAERAVRICGREALPHFQEPEITAVFCVEIARRLQLASDAQRIACAVLHDLEAAFQRAGVACPESLPNITNGLVARVSRHRPAEEARHGGDFGLLAVEPLFRLRWHNHFEVERGGRRNGILVQAKRRPYKNPWNNLTTTQKKVLRTRLAHAALLRYELDNPENTTLSEFRWNIMAGVTVKKVTAWLRSGIFPESVDTSTLVTGLISGCYGTSDPKIIESQICSDSGASMIVEVDWTDGDDPSDALLRINRDLMLPPAYHQEIRQKL